MRALVTMALIAMAHGAVPVAATAQTPYSPRGAAPSLLSATVFTGATTTPIQWQAGVGLRVRVSRLRFEPTVAYGRSGDFDSMTGSATLSVMLMDAPGVDAYVGAGAAYYRERSDASGREQTRALVAPAFVFGVETDLLGVGLFLEGRLLNREYGGDSGIGATDVGVTSIVAGVWLPFGPEAPR